MKEITRIHLAQTPFNAELGAKKELESYLSAVEKTLDADADTQKEIEARIVELLAERGISGEKVITIEDVEHIKKQLGAPTEFVDEQDVAVSGTSEKRMMRDEENGMIGGVLAGIAAYTGADVIWLRLAAIILAFLSLGMAVIVYIVLWIVMPPAKTAADRLQMAGKPVTLGAIKEQSQAVFVKASDKAKPLVVVLRVLLGLGFAGMALGALGLVIFVGVIFGFHAGPDLFAVMDAWLMVAFALAVVSGALFAILCGLLAYASFAWRMSKRLMVAAVAIVLAGLVTFSVALGIGAYGANLTQQNISDMTRTEKVRLNDLAGVKKLVTNNQDVSIDYRVIAGDPYAEVTVISRDDAKPRWGLERVGDTATITADGIKASDCENTQWFWDLCMNDVSIIVYGPALESLEADGHVTYDATTQAALDVTTKKDAIVSLSGGEVRSLRATVADGSVFDAGSAAVTDGQVAVGRGSSITFGVLSQLSLDVPDSCGANNQARVSVERVSTLKKGDVEMTQAGEIEENCAVISIDSLRTQMVD